MNINFRKLTASEIECRIGSVTAKGVSLLLYKDARVDMSILDETVGASNWTRSHRSIDGNLYCTISIWDEDKQLWIAKEDVGTESNTEKEKGQASDSFKRAGFNWGIGRELYTAPFIWIAGGDKNTKGKVTSIAYDNNGNISALTIVNPYTNETIYSYGGTATTPAKPKTTKPKSAPAPKKIEDAKDLVLIKECKTIQELSDLYARFSAEGKNMEELKPTFTAHKNILKNGTQTTN